MRQKKKVIVQSFRIKSSKSNSSTDFPTKNRRYAPGFTTWTPAGRLATKKTAGFQLSALTDA